MAENDIYNSKERYERFLGRLDRLTLAPDPDEKRFGNRWRKYHCRNAGNLRHFRRLADILACRDTAYVRRLRVMNVLKLICFATERELSTCGRNDINHIVAFAHERLRSPKSKSDFIRDIRFLWRQLFPEADAQGRPDETITPYPVRHLSAKIDKSREKRRQDRLTVEEFEALVKAFAQDRRMQAFITLAHESLGRPQELLYVRIGDVELYDSYAKVWISEHGKEGTGFLQCIDSFPYVAAWLNEHPLRHDQKAFFFINLGTYKQHRQMKPENVNKHIRQKLKLLGIDKPITAYSLKRNGVTFRRLRGDSDLAIQHAARWTSTKQLKTYDMSETEDAFRMELARRGYLDDPSLPSQKVSEKRCGFCNTLNAVGEDICATCKRPLDRRKIEAEIGRHQHDIETERQARERLEKELASLHTEFGQVNRFMNALFERNPAIIDHVARAAVAPPEHDEFRMLSPSRSGSPPRRHRVGLTRTTADRPPERYRRLVSGVPSR